MARHRKSLQSKLPAAIGAALFAGGMLLAAPTGIAFAAPPVGPGDPQGPGTGGPGPVDPGTDPDPNGPGGNAGPLAGIGAGGYNLLNFIGTQGNNAQNFVGTQGNNLINFVGTAGTNAQRFVGTGVNNILVSISGQSNGGSICVPGPGPDCGTDSASGPIP